MISDNGAAIENSKWPTKRAASTATRKATKLPCVRCRAVKWDSVATAAEVMAEEVRPVE